MGQLTFVAKAPKDYVCDSCKKTIPKAAPCLWDKENKKNYHEACKPATDSFSTDRPLERGKPVTPVLSASLNFDVDKNFEQAEKFVKEKYGEAVAETDAGLGLIQEYAHQKYGAWSVRQQHLNKLKEQGRI